jgi:hypothetical protein
VMRVGLKCWMEIVKYLYQGLACAGTFDPETNTLLRISLPQQVDRVAASYRHGRRSHFNRV